MTQISPQELSEMESEFAQRILQNLRPYYFDALKFHSGDRDELRRRRKIIGGTDIQVDNTFYGYGLLSALLDDRKGWEMAVKELGVNQDPGFGYLAYRYICHYRKQTDQPKTWAFTLKQSAEFDHLPSKWLLLKQDDEGEAPGAFLNPSNVLRGLFLLVRFVYLKLRNSKDRRLVTYSGVSGDSIAT